MNRPADHAAGSLGTEHRPSGNPGPTATGHSESRHAAKARPTAGPLQPTHRVAPHSEPAPAGAWSPSALAGRLSELSDKGPTAALTLSVDLLLEAQRCAEPAAWITACASSFFPCDVAQSGIDLAALPVIRTPNAAAAGRAADRLLRSGAFGLVVLDLGNDHRLPLPLQTRLLGLARKHDAAVVFLTNKGPTAPSLGPLISLRAATSREKLGASRFACSLDVLKDKRRGPGWTHRECYRGPAGLR